jgi:hypothetical protein
MTGDHKAFGGGGGFLSALTLELKHRIVPLEGEAARLKSLSDQAADLRVRIDALTKLLLQKHLVSAEETAAMLLSRRTCQRKKSVPT